MSSVAFYQGTVCPSPQRTDSMDWDCTVCGRARLCPYAAPCLSDARVACPSCGDLLAHISNDRARAAVSNLEIG